MKNKMKFMALFLVLILMLGGCKKDQSETESGSEESTNAESDASLVGKDTEMFTDRDYEVSYDESTSIRIEFNEDAVSCSSDAVRISGTTVTITEEATYILSGTLDDGMVVVDAGDTDKLQLVLDDASITSATSAPIYILEADKVFITMAEGTTNTLTNGGTFTAIDDNNIDGAVFSKQDLTFNGSGSLTVTSPAGHGIVCKDDLVFTSGTYTVNCASHGLDANDSVRIVNASLTVAAGKDGIHAENSDDTTLGFVYIASGMLDISAEGDGMSAGNYMQIEDGTFHIVSGGGSANASKQTSESWGGFMGGHGGMGGPGAMGGHGQMGDRGNMGQSGIDSTTTPDTSESDDSSTSIKGMKSTGNMLINGGTFTVDSADDTVHSNASITVNGGSFEVASGDDGFHADETLTITSGKINITESYEGLEALDIKVSGGDITMVASDDGINAAGGTDESGYGGERGNDMFGGRGPGGMGGPGGGMGSSSSNGSIVISGGNIYMNASGDGIDANGSLEISGGVVTVCGPTQGDTAVLDYDTSAVITGGTFIGTGASQMAQTFSDSEQGVVAVSVGNQSAGTEIVLKDKNGNVEISYEPKLSFAIVILSSPDIVKGEIYSITVGEASGEFEAS